MLPGFVKDALHLVLSLVMAIIFAGVIISWLRAAGVRVPYYHPIIRAIEQSYEAMIRPIRRAVPTAGGGLDFAPMIVLIILMILQRVIARL
jgi:YggT family protein